MQLWSFYRFLYLIIAEGRRNLSSEQSEVVNASHIFYLIFFRLNVYDFSTRILLNMLIKVLYISMIVFM